MASPCFSWRTGQPKKRRRPERVAVIALVLLLVTMIGCSATLRPDASGQAVSSAEGQDSRVEPGQTTDAPEDRHAPAKRGLLDDLGLEYSLFFELVRALF